MDLRRSKYWLPGDLVSTLIPITTNLKLLEHGFTQTDEKNFGRVCEFYSPDGVDTWLVKVFTAVPKTYN